jgi:hypothetical protein
MLLSEKLPFPCIRTVQRVCQEKAKEASISNQQQTPEQQPEQEEMDTIDDNLADLLEN